MGSHYINMSITMMLDLLFCMLSLCCFVGFFISSLSFDVWQGDIFFCRDLVLSPSITFVMLCFVVLQQTQSSTDPIFVYNTVPGFMNMDCTVTFVCLSWYYEAVCVPLLSSDR